MKKFFKSEKREGKLIELKELIEGNIARLYKEGVLKAEVMNLFLKIGLLNPQKQDLFALTFGHKLVKEIESKEKVALFFLINEYSNGNFKMEIIIKNMSPIINDWGDVLCGNEGKTYNALNINFVFNGDSDNCHHFLIAELPNRSR